MTQPRLENVRLFFAMQADSANVYVGPPPANVAYPRAAADGQLVCIHELTRRKEPTQAGYAGGSLSVQVDTWHRFSTSAEEARTGLTEVVTDRTRNKDGSLAEWSTMLGIAVRDVVIEREYSQYFGPDDGDSRGVWRYSFDIKILY